MNESPAPKKRRVWPYWLVIISLSMTLGLSLFFTFSFGAALVMLGGGEFDPDGDYAVDEHPVFEEEWSYGEGDAKVVRLAIEGLIFREEEAGLFETPIDKIEQINRAIRAASNDEDVDALILEVNSPGGGVAASDELYHAVQRFKASREDRKVIVYMSDLAASGAYYISADADWIVAQPTALVGSIGVIMQTLNWKALSEKIGVSDVTIKSGQNKDMLNPFRDTDPEEVALLQEIVDEMHTRFRDIVAEGRNLSPGDVDALADGRLFTAVEAHKRGLVDEIGYWDDVVAKTRELVGEKEIRIVRYYEHEDFWDYLLGIRAGLTRPLRALQNHRPLQYLWQP